MTAREALKILGVTRKTLDNYVNRGLIKVYKYQMPHKMGWNNYDDDDVYALAGMGLRSKDKKIVAYVRVKGLSKDADRILIEQKRGLEMFMKARGVQLDEIFEDRSGSMTTDLSKRPGLHELIQSVLRGEVAALVLDTKCRLARWGFEIYDALFAYHGVKVVVANQVLGNADYQAEQSDDLAEVLAAAKIDRLGAK